MICPYCSSEMKEGQIVVYGEKLSWSPINEKRSVVRWSISPNGIALGKYNYWKGSHVKAFYCNDCNKIIIDVVNTSKID